MADIPAVFPWGIGDPDDNTIYQLPIDKVLVPDLRVTSTFTPEQQEELIESIKSEGQKMPIECVWVNQQCILADGLNRILAMRHLGIPMVLARVKKGTMRDVQINNIITARHRGRENPAQTAEVITDLLNNEHMEVDDVKRKLGLTDTTFRRLLAISSLPGEVKDMIKHNRLGVMSAFHISQLEDPASQLEVAELASKWGYTEAMVKERVIELLNPSLHQETAHYIF